MTLKLPALKAALTRAKKSGDPDKVLATVQSAYRTFDETYWPDCWSDWERAKQDALVKKNMFTRIDGRGWPY